jgi:hypothetical protein
MANGVSGSTEHTFNASSLRAALRPGRWRRHTAAFAAVCTTTGLVLSPGVGGQGQGSSGLSSSARDGGYARPVAGYQIVVSTTPEAVLPGARYGWAAECPSPKVALGGGYTLGDAVNFEPELTVLESAPLVNNEGFYDGKFWRVEVKNIGVAPSHFTVYAVCARAAP